MTLSQLDASCILHNWQATRHHDLTPEQRLEIAFYDFLLPPPIPLALYDAELRAVEEAMRETA